MVVDKKVHVFVLEHLVGIVAGRPHHGVVGALSWLKVAGDAGVDTEIRRGIRQQIDLGGNAFLERIGDSSHDEQPRDDAKVLQLYRERDGLLFGQRARDDEVLGLDLEPRTLPQLRRGRRGERRRARGCEHEQKHGVTQFHDRQYPPR